MLRVWLLGSVATVAALALRTDTFPGTDADGADRAGKKGKRNYQIKQQQKYNGRVCDFGGPWPCRAAVADARCAVRAQGVMQIITLRCTALTPGI